MVAKQLSIFLENKSGRLTEVTEVLAKENINLSALCIAENADFGILRGIVSLQSARNCLMEVMLW